APEWSEAQLRELLAAYLDQSQDSSLIDSWLARLSARRSHKEAR
ncbi:MAG: lipopolysaccharide kinase InaA family protein, partial [Pseudomonas sp.]